MKSYRDNGLEQMSGTKLNAGPRHFILSGKTRKRKITKKKRSSLHFHSWQIVAVNGSGFPTLFSLQSLFLQQSLVQKTTAGPSTRKPYPLTCLPSPGFSGTQVHFQRARLLRAPPPCSTLKAGSQEKHSEACVPRGQLEARENAMSCLPSRFGHLEVAR